MSEEERLEDIIAWGNRLNPNEAKAYNEIVSYLEKEIIKIK